MMTRRQAIKLIENHLSMFVGREITPELLVEIKAEIVHCVRNARQKELAKYLDRILAGPRGMSRVDDQPIDYLAVTRAVAGVSV